MKKSMIFYFLIIYTYGFSQEIHISDAVNLATQQRVLAQKMAKDKLFIEVNEKTSIAQKELEASIKIFEENLELLKKFSPTKTITHEVAEQEFAFKLYKDLIIDTTKRSMEEVISYNTIFLATCDDVVKSIIKHSKTIKHNNSNQRYVVEQIAEATSAASRIKLLSQRLSFYYGLEYFKKSRNNVALLKNISKKIENNLNYLTLLEFNTLEIDDSLGGVVFLWTEIKTKINNQRKTLSPNELFNLCNEILSKADNTTQLYVDLNKS